MMEKYGDARVSEAAVHTEVPEAEVDLVVPVAEQATYPILVVGSYTDLHKATVARIMVGALAEAVSSPVAYYLQWMGDPLNSPGGYGDQIDFFTGQCLQALSSKPW